MNKVPPVRLQKQILALALPDAAGKAGDHVFLSLQSQSQTGNDTDVIRIEKEVLLFFPGSPQVSRQVHDFWMSRPTSVSPHCVMLFASAGSFDLNFLFQSKMHFSSVMHFPFSGEVEYTGVYV